jgi:hypothetical protein
MTRKFYRPKVGRAPSLAAAAASLAVSALTVGGALALPAASSANTVAIAQCGDVYDNWGAGFRVGAFPYADGTYGFQPGGNAGSGARLDACTGVDRGYGTAMVAELTGSYSQSTGSGTNWTWQAPPDTVITGYASRIREATRDFDGTSGTSGEVSIYNSTQTDPQYDFRMQRPGSQGPGVQSAPIIVGASIPVGARWVRFNAGCDGVSIGRTCPQGSPGISQLLVYGATFNLDDTSAPTVSSTPTGGLVDNRYWKGTLSVTAGLADRGLGVQALIVQQRASDGTWTDKSWQTIDPYSGKCLELTNAGNRGPYRAFSTPRPCPLNTVADLEVNTDAFAEGEGQWRIIATDASDNRTVVSGSQSRIIDRTAPAVSFADTPDSCTVGGRVAVQGTATDALAGVQSVSTIVVGKDGKRVPVAADGTIECPTVEQGPLAVTTDAVDRAGNTASVTREKAVAVKAVPVVAPPTTTIPTDGEVGGGGEKPLTPAPTPTTPTTPVAPATPVAPVAPSVPVAPPVDKVATVTQLLKCYPQSVVLTEAFPSGRNDVVRGVAERQFVGKDVALYYGPNHKYVGTQKVGQDGTFRFQIKAPTGKGIRSNMARYQARVGKVKSSWIKRVRRMVLVDAYRTASAGDSVWVTGRVTKPFKAGTKVAIKMLRGTSCVGKTVATTRVSSTGAFGVKLAVSVTDPGVVLYAEGRVQVSAKGKKTTATRTLPTPVQLHG